MKFRKILALQLCIVALAVTVTGCGASSGVTSGVEMDSAMYNTNSYEGSYSDIQMDFNSTESYTKGEVVLAPAVTEEHTESEIEIKEEVAPNLTEEKLVYRCNVTIESKEYEATKYSLQKLIETYNGIIQSEEEYDNAYDWYYDEYHKDSGTKDLHIECRIPSKHYQAFLAGLETFGENSKITNKSASVENITQQYHDNTIRIETLRVQEERLMNMLEQADNVQDMLSIETRLIDVQTELNILTNKLIKMDTDVAYSYISINLEEVLEYSPEVKESTFFTRMGDAFKEVCEFTGELFEDTLVFIMYLIPVIILLGLPILLIVKLIMLIIKKYDEKHPRKPEVTIYRKCKQQVKEQVNPEENQVKEEKEE